MKLQSIEIQGFKSFRDKIKLQFNDSICAIVGPNGSGKSNISDAIRWVLGEQSAKTLRGSKMQDIIFAGTNKSKPLNFAQVSLNFNNSDKWIPVDYNEVTITRRVFRTGESEYYLNKKQCRLKDVKEIFMDTGIGKEGYSIIGQGRIDEILSSKSEDRRFIFEEASGISKFKYKKEESLKKLDKTIGNLVRIEDILSQKIGQRDYLKEQAEKAEIGLELTNKIKLLELNFNKLELEKYENNISANIIEMSSLKEDVKKYNEKINNLLPETENLQKDSEKLKKEYESLQYKSNNQDKIINELILEYKINEEKLKHEEEKSLTLEEDKKYTINKKSELIIKLENCNNEKIAINNKIIKINENVKKIIIDKKDLEKKIKDNRKNYNKLISKIEENKNLLKDIEINKRTKENIEKSELEKLKVNEKNKEIILEKIKKLEIELNIKLDEKNKLDEKIQLENINFKKINEEISTNENEKRILDNTRTNLNISLKEKEREYNFYKNIIDNYDGFNRQVSSFFKKIKKTDLVNLPLGTLADLISVEEKYSKAINSVLSGTLQNIVVKSEIDAKSLIEFLKNEKIGRLTFLPLNKIRGNAKNIEFNDSRIITIASNIIECEDEYKSLINYFLGKTIIVANISDAIEISRKFKNYRVVTLDGDVFNSWGSVVGGYNTNKKTGNIINRNKKVNDLSEKIKKIKNDIIELDKKIINLDNNLEDKLSYKSKISKNIFNLEKFIKDQNLELKEIETLIRIKNNSLDEINNLILEFNNSKDTIDSFVNIETLESNTKAMEEELEKINNEFENYSKELNKLDYDIVSYNSKKDSIERDLNICKNNIEELTIEIEDIENRIKNNKKLILENFDKIKNKKAKDNILKEQIEKEKSSNINFNKIIPEKKNKYESLLAEYNFKKDEVNDIKNILNKLEYNYDLISNKLEHLSSEKKKIVDFTKDEYNVYIECFTIIEKIHENKNDLKTLKNKLKNLGHFSIDSISEYKIIYDETEFLINQKTDLIKSKEDIEKIIENLDKDMKELFTKSFWEINEKFNKIFHILFAGGHASLEIQDKDILNGGIEIIAEPPGKKMQNLSLLSGGERALTAVALLFAIFETKPSPFCILDEIDAALDEANIYRYTNYLKTFTDTTQFIMISHRKPTMEIADILYGVSMEEEGVSKVISLELE